MLGAAARRPGTLRRDTPPHTLCPALPGQSVTNEPSCEVGEGICLSIPSYRQPMGMPAQIQLQGIAQLLHDTGRCTATRRRFRQDGLEWRAGIRMNECGDPHSSVPAQQYSRCAEVGVKHCVEQSHALCMRGRTPPRGNTKHSALISPEAPIQLLGSPGPTEVAGTAAGVPRSYLLIATFLQCLVA